LCIIPTLIAYNLLQYQIFGHYTISDQISNQKQATKANKSPKKAKHQTRNPATTAQNPPYQQACYFPIQKVIDIDFQLFMKDEEQMGNKTKGYALKQ
jgi:hypothetical protein